MILFWEVCWLLDGDIVVESEEDLCTGGLILFEAVGGWGIECVYYVFSFTWWLS